MEQCATDGCSHEAVPQVVGDFGGEDSKHAPHASSHCARPAPPPTARLMLRFGASPGPSAGATASRSC
eukprot:1820200-Rhodomonas_salina.2